MQLVITEKNIAAQKIAEILSVGKPKTDKVYATTVYRFTKDGEDWVSIGLKGHILGVDFPETLEYDGKKWFGRNGDEILDASYVPDDLPKPPFNKKKPFFKNGVELKQWKIPTLPYLTYAPLVKTPDEKEIIRAVKTLTKKADHVIIATDFDREGELIGSDACSVVREASPKMPISRVRYSAITKQEITHAFDNQTVLDEALAAAGESRRYIDLVWGAVLTRYLTVVKFAGIGNTRSAGRVQTPTLALIVQLERERKAFIPEPYWVLKGTFSTGAEESFDATHERERFKKEEEANAAFAAVEHATQGTVVSIEKKERSVPAPIPFNTTALQAAAASEGISPARTMRLAETLYMEGFISYPRVDNTVYPSSLDLSGIVSSLGANPVYAQAASSILSKSKIMPTRGKVETTDHPPIHPTGLGDPDKLSAQEKKLYNLIVRRFLATLMDAAKVENTKLTIDVNGEHFVAKGDVTTYPGFRAIYSYGVKKDEHLPITKQGDVLSFSNPLLIAKETEPPARYSQGRLIKKMEELGLGTKSTRHSIIERLYDVNYVQNEPIEPTSLGIAVIDALEAYAPHIASADMTSHLEDEMTEICEGKNTLDKVVLHSRNLLSDIMRELIPHREDVKEKIAEATVADARIGVCPKCGGDLLVRQSSTSRSAFIGCSNWPECDATYPLPQGKIEATEETCPVCHLPQVKVTPFRSKAVTRCIDPACSTNSEPEIIVGECAACKAKGLTKNLIAKKSPRTLKRFIRCENYDECQTSYPLPQRGTLEATGEVCETCGAPVVIINNGRGPWRICVNMSCSSKEKSTNTSKGASRKSTKKSSKK